MTQKGPYRTIDGGSSDNGGVVTAHDERHITVSRETAERLLTLTRWMSDHGGGDTRRCGELKCPSCEARDLAVILFEAQR